MKYPDLTKANLRIRELETEVERLQAIIQANDNYDQDATEREVERLKALAKSYRRDWITAEAEVKRLRAATTAWRRFWGMMSSNAIQALPPHARKGFEDAAQATIAALAEEKE
jgi:uncharacterized protein YPO0396